MIPTDEKAWQKKASKYAKSEGHSFVYKEYFPKTQFEGVCYCPLHFKTVKVLDVLQLAMLAMSSWGVIFEVSIFESSSNAIYKNPRE